MSKTVFMRTALDLAPEAVGRGDGGPFGAVIGQAGTIVGEGWNRVLKTRDPTGHAEVVAIPDACARLGTFDLSDCERPIAVSGTSRSLGTGACRLRHADSGPRPRRPRMEQTRFLLPGGRRRLAAGRIRAAYSRGDREAVASSMQQPPPVAALPSR